MTEIVLCLFFFFQAEDGIRDGTVTGVQTCALPIWVEPESELAIRGVPRLNWNGLPLRIEVPAEIAGDKLRKARLTPHREPGAAATYRLVALDAHILRFGGLAGEVCGEVIALQVRPRQVSRGELLARVAHPPGGGQSKGLDAARADRLVG